MNMFVLLLYTLSLRIPIKNIIRTPMSNSKINIGLSWKCLIPCHDIVVSSNIPAKRQQSLIDGLPKDYGKTGQLKKSLTVVVGMIVVHTANVDVEDGLTNGATGVVKHVDFRWMEGTNRPSIIWVLFDDPRVGKATREKKTGNFTTQAFIQTGHLYLKHNEHL